MGERPGQVHGWVEANVFNVGFVEGLSIFLISPALVITEFLFLYFLYIYLHKNWIKRVDATNIQHKEKMQCKEEKRDRVKHSVLKEGLKGNLVGATGDIKGSDTTCRRSSPICTSI